jgi:hypothetical protein
MHNQKLAMEHYRIHVMEQWPDGPRKQAGLAAARSTIESLARIMSVENRAAVENPTPTAP